MYADGMRLQGPTCHGLVGRRRRSNPERTYSVEEALAFFPCHGHLPKVEQRRRPPCGHETRSTTREIAGGKSAGIIPTDKPDGAVVGPSEVWGRRRKRQRLLGQLPSLLE